MIGSVGVPCHGVEGGGCSIYAYAGGHGFDSVGSKEVLVETPQFRL